MAVRLFYRLLVGLILATSLLPSPAQPFARGGLTATAQTTKVAIFLGQSNSVGGNFDTTGQSLLANLGSGGQQGWLYAPTAGINSNVQIFAPNQATFDYSNSLIPGWHIGTSTGFFTPLVSGWNNDGLTYQPPPAYPTTSGTAYQNWGPEVEFSWLWLQNQTAPLYIIKFAVSGTPLCQSAGGEDWSVASSGKLYAIAKDIIAAALAKITNPQIVVVDWMQGEADATDSTCASNYQTNLTNFINSFRTDVDAGRLTPFIINRIRTTSGGFSSTVRSAQDSFSTFGNATVVNTDSYPLQGDNVHYTAQGQCCTVGTSGFNPASGGLGSDDYNAGHSAGFY